MRYYGSLFILTSVQNINTVTEIQCVLSGTLHAWECFAHWMGCLVPMPYHAGKSLLLIWRWAPVDSQTFHKLSKIIFSRNVCIVEIFSLWKSPHENFKLKLCWCAQRRTKFQLEILTINVISGIYIFTRLFWRACETFVKQSPDLQGGTVKR